MTQRNNNIFIIAVIIAALVFGCWKLIKGHSTTQVDNCIKNLRAIEGAKLQAAQELHLKAGDVVPLNKLSLYAAWPPRNKVNDRCKYSVNPIGTPATCSAGHVIPK